MFDFLQSVTPSVWKAAEKAVQKAGVRPTARPPRKEQAGGPPTDPRAAANLFGGMYTDDAHGVAPSAPRNVEEPPRDSTQTAPASGPPMTRVTKSREGMHKVGEGIRAKPILTAGAGKEDESRFSGVRSEQGWKVAEAAASEGKVKASVRGDNLNLRFPETSSLDERQELADQALSSLAIVPRDHEEIDRQIAEGATSVLAKRELGSAERDGSSEAAAEEKKQDPVPDGKREDQDRPEHA